MSIDIKAGTWITAFDGDTHPLEFLQYDITNIAHHIRSNAEVCTIGVGGGRDILTALYFDQRDVIGIELNQTITQALNGVFGEFSGHLDKNPKVRFVVDEARSYLARTSGQFDIIQLSLIDTFAATAAGAFVLAENALYTVEAWDLIIERLKPNGVFTASRYYFHKRPAEAYRMLALAVSALQKRGIDNYRDHLVMMKNANTYLGQGVGVGTLLVSNRPFDQTDLVKLSQVADRMDFELVLSPTHAADPVIETIANGHGLEDFYPNYEIDISPPTDDRPFFFQMLRLKDIFDTSRWRVDDINWKNLKAVLVLGALLLIVTILTVLCIFVPLSLRSGLPSLRTGYAIFLLFASIGFGFMFIEIAQMQRFMVFLGHPTYALSVVLFTLLLSSGIGSLASEKVAERFKPALVWLVFCILLVVLVGAGSLTPKAIEQFADAATPTRILVAVLLLFPAGFMMVCPFRSELK